VPSNEFILDSPARLFRVHKRLPVLVGSIGRGAGFLPKAGPALDLRCGPADGLRAARLSLGPRRGGGVHCPARRAAAAHPQGSRRSGPREAGALRSLVILAKTALSG
jgi:hypothetical protein